MSSKRKLWNENEAESLQSGSRGNHQKRGFARKLAMNNIVANTKFYLPYILAASAMIAMFYIMVFLATNSGIKSLEGAEYMSVIMVLGSIVISLFSVIFLFYINGFLMKRRNKEIGIYNILGMEKRHIGLILCAENIITSCISILLGILIGILFSKLVFMMLCAMMSAKIDFVFSISWIAVAATVILFAGSFLAILLWNQLRVRRSKPIELLHGSNSGEKEPKTKVLLSIIGIICMGSGYYMAITITNPLEALRVFFIAVILVIIGTYLLFTTVSIAILKALKKNEKFYYKPQNFTTVSGMLYRMKQNAVGMANICILSTMVLVMVSTTVCLHMGIEGIIDRATPYQCNCEVNYFSGVNAASNDKLDEVVENTNKIADEQGITLSNLSAYGVNTSYCEPVKNGDDNSFAVSGANMMNGDTCIMNLITAEQYQRATGESISLEGNQMAMLADSKQSMNTITINGIKFDVTDNNAKKLPRGDTAALSVYSLVVADQSVIDKIASQNKEGVEYPTLEYTMIYDTDVSDSRAAELSSDVVSQFGENYDTADCTMKKDFTDAANGLVGGFLFLGIFLGIIFTFAAALIIYYKQLSEGYYDKDKYEIMQKVGMSIAEVKQSVRRQVITVFFAPLIVAGIHVAGAFHMISKLLLMFTIDDTKLLVGCTITTFAVFALIYGLVYLVTAREYYKIIRR